jgi:hypothetical protein
MKSIFSFLLILTAAAAQAAVSAELAVSPVTSYTDSATYSAVASNGEDFLALRHGKGNGVYVARVNPSAPAGAPVLISPTGWGGSLTAGPNGRYFLSWTENDGPHTAVLDAGGRIVHAETLEVGELRVSSTVGAASTGGTQLVVAFNGFTGALQATLLDADGVPLVRHIALGSTQWPFVVTDTSTDDFGYLFYVVTHDAIDIWRIGTSGDARLANHLTAGARAESLAAASSGGRHFLFWTLATDSYPITPLTTEAAQLSSSGEVVARTSRPAIGSLRGAVADAGGAVVAAMPVAAGGTAASLVRFDSALNVTRTLVTESGAAAFDVHPLARSADRTLVVWKGTGGGNAAFATLTDFAASMTAPVTLPGTPAAQEAPAIAASGNGYLVVWRETAAAGMSALRAVRLRSDGSRLDAAPLEVALTQTAGARPAVASDGNGYLIVWEERSDAGHYILGQRMTADGQLLDRIRIDAAEGDGEASIPTGRPKVAFDGRTFMVVWTRTVPPIGACGPWSRIYGARVSTTGLLLDTSPFLVSFGNMSQSDPDITWDGQNFLVVWKSACTIFHGGIDELIDATHVTSDGRPVDQLHIRTKTNSNGSLAGEPAVSSNGRNEVVVWSEDFRKIYANVLVDHAAPLTTTGYALGLRGGHSLVRVAWNGSAFVPVWSAEDGYLDSGVYAAQIGAFGEARGVSETVSSSATDELTPDVASSGGTTAVVYTRYATEPEYAGVNRVFLRFVETAFTPKRRVAGK